MLFFFIDFEKRGRMCYSIVSKSCYFKSCCKSLITSKRKYKFMLISQSRTPSVQSARRVFRVRERLQGRHAEETTDIEEYRSAIDFSSGIFKNSQKSLVLRFQTTKTRTIERFRNCLKKPSCRSLRNSQARKFTSNNF